MNAFVHNYLYPTLAGLASAIITALASNAPHILADGLQSSDWPQLAGIAAAAGLGFLAGLLDRHAGAEHPWIQPKA